MIPNMTHVFVLRLPESIVLGLHKFLGVPLDESLVVKITGCAIAALAVFLANAWMRRKEP